MTTLWGISKRSLIQGVSNEGEVEMTRDDIIKMANDVGIKGPAPARAGFKMYASPQRLLSFAALVAAAEREKVARWMIRRGYATGHGDSTEDLLQELDWQVQEPVARGEQ